VTTQFDYNGFLDKNMHEQLFIFPTEGMIQYSSILASMFMFYQPNKFSFLMQKLDQEGKPQAITS
jgi:hypothetical protein